MGIPVEGKPLAVIGSPPCTPFSQLQSLNPWTEERRRKWDEGVNHVKFVLSVYEHQISNGRVFLHEHPAHAKSWMIKEVKKLAQKQGVMIAEADQCMYGLKKPKAVTRSQR